MEKLRGRRGARRTLITFRLTGQNHTSLGANPMDLFKAAMPIIAINQSRIIRGSRHSPIIKLAKLWTTQYGS